MYVVDGIAYAKDFNNKDLSITDIKIVSELCMLVTFSNGEKKIFDANYLTQYQVFEKIKDYEIFKKTYIENGIIVWNNGEIDVGAETVYNNSYEYEQETIV